MLSRLAAFGTVVLLLVGLLYALRPHAAAQDRGKSQRGDLNYNGRIDFHDIEPFVVALFDPAQWRSRYNRTQRELLDVADFDANGVLDRGDIHGFGKAMVRAGAGGGDSGGAGGGGVITGTGIVDLDVDSDNNDGTNLPGRTDPEDLIEDDPSETGKFVLVNDDDDDRDGNPDKDQNGTIDDERDDLVPLVLEITPASNVLPFEFLDYRLIYPTNVRLWRSALRGDLSTDVVVSGATQTQQVWILGDFNGDGALDSLDIEPFILALFDPDEYAIQFPGIDPVVVGDMNGDGALDALDIEPFTDALFSGIWSYVPVRMWIEGLSPSAGQADTRFVAEADTDKDGSFESDDAVRTTIFSLSPNTTIGPVGTLVTWTLQPAVSPLAFNSTTSASWSGFFDPLVGDPATLQISYSAAQVSEQSSEQAKLIVGDGTPSNIPDGATFGTSGLVFGDMSFDFAGLTVTRQLTYSFELSAEWRRVDFDTQTGTVRSVGAIPERMDIYTAEPGFDQTELPNAYWYFRLFVYLLEENPDTIQNSPPTITVDLVTTNPNGGIVDRLNGVVLTKMTDDNDPLHITYRSSIDIPLVLVDRDLNKSNYPTLLLLKAVDGGRAFGVPTP